jgi:hypothetical protein
LQDWVWFWIGVAVGCETPGWSIEWGRFWKGRFTWVGYGKETGREEGEVEGPSIGGSGACGGNGEWRQVEEPAGNAAAARHFSSGAGRASLALNNALFCKYLMALSRLEEYMIMQYVQLST